MVKPIKNLDNEISLLIRPYKSKQLDPEEAIKAYINPGDRIFIDSGCSEPLDLTQKLIELGPKLPDTEILHFISLSDLDYYKSAGGKEELNYKYFSGTILLENKPMLHILHDVGHPLVSKEVSYGEVDFKFDITTTIS